MGERKGLVTYIDPDYDPSIIPKKKKIKGGDARVDVRLALPFSMTCKYPPALLYRCCTSYFALC
jgi:hypothetical protein